MSTSGPVRTTSAFARLKQSFRQWQRGSMPVCGCDAAATLIKPAPRAKPAAEKSSQTAAEPDPERLARVAAYALSGYFHSGYLADMFVVTPDIWIERIAEDGR
jgi:hypothetical protein